MNSSIREDYRNKINHYHIDESLMFLMVCYLHEIKVRFKVESSKSCEIEMEMRVHNDEHE
jgi:hypothetical protein